MLHWNQMNDKQREYTMLEPAAMDVLINTVKKAPKEGIIVIAGTAHGGDAMKIMKELPDRYVIVIDSFEGLASPVEQDGPEAEGFGGHNAGGVEKYKSNFESLKRKLPHEIHKMWITEENLKSIGNRDIAMLFMDLDHYSPVKACLNFFKPMMVPGSKILSHDWKFFRTVGVEKACEEFAPGMWKEVHGFGLYTGK